MDHSGAADDFLVDRRAGATVAPIGVSPTADPEVNIAAANDAPAMTDDAARIVASCAHSKVTSAPKCRTMFLAMAIDSHNSVCRKYHTHIVNSFVQWNVRL